MKFAIHGRTFKKEVEPYIVQLFNLLDKHAVDCQISAQLAEFLETTSLKNMSCRIYGEGQAPRDADFFISLGGDGTLLETVTHVGASETPIIGVNTGRLGFLATTAPEQIEEMIKHLLHGYYQIDPRALIRVEADADLFGNTNFGLNDFTITKRDTASMITVHTYIDGEYLNSYWADGLIVATPTGSTGYSLSCGGPVVLPQSNNFVISPVSPHNLTVRPLIVSDSSTISFTIEGRSHNFLVSLDSRSKVIDGSTQIAVRKEEFKAKLVKFREDYFLNTLRKKLNWGFDVRN
ncbi:MAG TPA: NAD kinase [Microscillaceae bacterium]|nr:NAD kinase [Microscillaceae bacterium]